MSSSEFVSREPVGSSARRRLGSFIRALATATLPLAHGKFMRAMMQAVLVPDFSSRALLFLGLYPVRFGSASECGQEGVSKRCTAATNGDFETKPSS